MIIVLDSKKHQKTFTRRYLSFLLNHPIYYKIETIYDLIDRAILSHPEFMNIHQI